MNRIGGGAKLKAMAWLNSPRGGDFVGMGVTKKRGAVLEFPPILLLAAQSRRNGMIRYLYENRKRSLSWSFLALIWQVMPFE